MFSVTHISFQFFILPTITAHLPAPIPAPAVQIAITTISGLISTFLLVGVHKFDMSNRQTFEDFWSILCENDWQIAFKAFIFGNLFFMLSLIQGSWVLYNDHEYGDIAAIIVTVICVCCIVSAFP